jgi:hypothetical protein
MSGRFQDTATAYRWHRAVTNEAETISTAVCEYAANDLRLTRHRLRVLDAGTGDGQVLKRIAEVLLRNHRDRPCVMLLKEYDFHHIEMLLQNIAPLLRRSPRLSLFVTNRLFRQLKDFAEDLSAENTVCFDDVAGYRLLAMRGTATLLSQEDSLRLSFPPLEKRSNRANEPIAVTPLLDLWDGERMILAGDLSAAPATPALAALGDEIRAREIYDELTAAGGRGKQFTVTIARTDGGVVTASDVNEFVWDLAVVSHAFNRDKDPGWICRNILSPLCQGLAVGGVLVNVHAVDGGQVSELERVVFGDQFSFRASPAAIAEALQSILDIEEFELLPDRQVSYQALITAEIFSSLEPWERKLALHHLAISVAYHLQIPDDAWTPSSEAIETKIQELLERDGRLGYALSIGGVKRRA